MSDDDTFKGLWHRLQADLDSRPERLLGKYRILREVARGGMGIVFEAEKARSHSACFQKSGPRTKTSVNPLVSPGTRFVELDSDAT